MNPKQLKARFPYMFAGENIGLSFCRGWFPLFTKLCDDIDALLGPDSRGFHWVQVKEKFGSARFCFYWEILGDGRAQARSKNRSHQCAPGDHGGLKRWLSR